LLSAIVIFHDLSLTGENNALKSAGAWWPFVVNHHKYHLRIVAIQKFLKGEGRNYFDFFKFDTKPISKESALGTSLFHYCRPISMLPNIILGNCFIWHYVIGSRLMFLQLPHWAAGYFSLLFFRFQWPSASCLHIS
jgi:hypothetical protein